MRDFLTKTLSGLRRGVVTFCAVVAMLVVYGVGAIVTQGLAIAGISTAALVSTATEASARRRRGRGRSRRRSRRRGRGWSRGRGRWRSRRRRGRWGRGRRRGRGGVYIRF